MSMHAGPEARPPQRPVAGRTVLVAGATGFVGSHVAKGLADRGAHVVALARRAEAADALARSHPGITPCVVDTWEEARTVRARVGAVAPAPDAVVAAVGGWWQEGPLVDVEPGTWRRLLEDRLTSHFLVARALAPLVAGQPDAVFVALNGIAGREPIVDAGPVSVAGAGQSMLYAVLARELGPDPRFHEVAVLAAIVGDARNLDPVAEVRVDAVTDAIARVLADPRTPPVLDVVASARGS